MPLVAWIVIAVLTLALLGAVMGWILNSGARRDLTTALAAEQAAHADAVKSAEHLETRTRTLRNELTEAHQTNAELTQRIGRANPTDGRSLGLWALERHRQARVAGTPLLGLAVGPGADLTTALPDAIRVELEVLREDVGTHGELGDVDLADELSPASALSILRVVQELAAILAKRSDELEVAYRTRRRRAHHHRHRTRLDRPLPRRRGVRGRGRRARRHAHHRPGPRAIRHAARRRSPRTRRRRRFLMTEVGRDELEELVGRFRITDPEQFRLADHDPASTDGIKNKSAAKERLAAGITLLTDLQGRLAAQQTHGVLVALQAMDAAGKDGVIRHVMSGLNPQGVRVTPFKAPSTQELAHHFLWRTTVALPERGEIGIFNRSHYEEVLVVRVHPEFLERQHLPPGSTAGIWKRRFREINDWERALVDSGFPVVKLFLHVSKQEQRARLLARIDEPAKNWKFSKLDVQERAHWDAYQNAYEEMIRHTSTPSAPWYVVPADQKWFSRLVVAGALASTLLDLDPQYPTVTDAQRAELADARTLLAADTE